MAAENKFLFQMYWGFLAFFLAYAFRGKIEAHWVAFCVIPMSILIYNLVVSNLWLVKRIKYIGIVSIALIFLARVAVIIDLPLHTEFHSQKGDYYSAIAKLANGSGVVFVNSYQKAAKFSFYENQPSFSDNNVFYRKNHYDLLDTERLFNNTDVLFVDNFQSYLCDSLQVTANDIVFYKKVDNYPIFNKLEATLSNYNFSALARSGKADLCIYNPYDYVIDLKKENLPFKFGFQISDSNYDKRYINAFKVENIVNLKPHSTTLLNVSWKLKETIPKGSYKLKVLLRAGNLHPKVISDTYKIVVNDRI